MLVRATRFANYSSVSCCMPKFYQSNKKVLRNRKVLHMITPINTKTRGNQMAKTQGSPWAKEAARAVMEKRVFFWMKDRKPMVVSAG